MNDSTTKLTKNVYMSKSKSDKPLVVKMIAGCAAAILIFHFAWFRQLTVNLHEWLFVVGDIILLIAFSYFSNASYKDADDPNKEYNRYIVVAIAAALCLWAGAWAAYVNEKVAPGSPQVEDSGKAFQGRNFEDMKQYVAYNDSLSAIPNMLVISDDYNVIAIDTTMTDWQKTVDSLLADNRTRS